VILLLVLRVYNTRTRSVEDFKPSHGNRVYMFVCGPTVYDHSHVGHARTYLAYDIIARYLRSKRYSLFYLMNITDVEDKIINKARESGDDPLRLADRFAKEFINDMEGLGISSVNLYAKASEHIPEIIAQISTLIQRGFAYKVDNDVYYDVSKFGDYGKLSGQNIEQLTTHRIDPDPRKKSVVDFALWKSQKPGEPAWDSPWGKGRPGWHIEDTAITTTYFGPQYDLHGGGLDLVFPHHEAEIAQAEAATGFSPLVRYWIHSGLLMISGARMGKSMGNFITIKEALSKHDVEALRLYYAMSHYRSQLDYDESNVYQAEQVLDKLRSVYNQFRSLEATTATNQNESATVTIEKVTSEAKDSFDAAMDDDFNTPRALAAMISFAKETEPYATKNIGRSSVERILQTFDYFGGIFGIFRPMDNQQDIAFDGLLNLLLKIREEARKRGDWATADTIRNSLTELGLGLEDTAAGARWYVASSKAPAKAI
jgi:cysteinyl-tRNA synthetase